MQLTSNVNFDITKDLSIIEATIEGKMTSMAAHLPPGENNFVRMYLVEPPNIPLAVFADVPYDLYIQIVLGRDITLKDGSNPAMIKVAAFDGKECLVATDISVPSVIWATLLLAPYSVADLSFFRDYACGKLALLLSEKGSSR